MLHVGKLAQLGMLGQPKGDYTSIDTRVMRACIGTLVFLTKSVMGTGCTDNINIPSFYCLQSLL